MRLTIEPKGEKGRAFSAELVAHAAADVLWNHADTRVKRPLWAVFAGPSESLRAFTENLRLGHVATTGDRHPDKFEFQKSVPFRWWTRTLPAGGSCTVVAHPSLLGWQVPVEDAYRYRFLVLPALSWLAAQRFDLDRAQKLLEALIASSVSDRIATEYDHYDYRRDQYTYKSKISLEIRHGDKLIGEPLHDLVGYGALLLHYLDHRLPLPIPRDPVFGAWLLLVGHYSNSGPVSIYNRIGSQNRRMGYEVKHPESAGCAPGFLFNAGSQDLPALSEWLGREVRRWFAVGGA